MMPSSVPYRVEAKIWLRDFTWKAVNIPSRKGEDKPSILLYFYQTGFYAGKIKAESEPHVPHVQNYYRSYHREVINTVRTRVACSETSIGRYLHPTRKSRSNAVKVFTRRVV